MAVVTDTGAFFPGFPVTLGQGVASTPLVIDVDGDGFSDLAGDGVGYIYAMDRFGNNLAGWPKSFPGSSTNATTAADVDGDSELEFLFGTTFNGSRYLFDLDGQDDSTAQWPMLLHDPKRTGDVAD